MTFGRNDKNILNQMEWDGTMETNRYTLFGEVNVPDDKKDELNGHVLELLDKCGIRKTEEIEVGGKVVTVIDYAVPDKNGVVSFDYSIFEKKKRTVCTYNMTSCKLYTPDRGYCEFGLTMNLIMILQEAYTNGTCYMMDKDKPLTYATGYLRLLHSLLGKSFKLQNRGRVWEMLLYFRNNHSDITADDIWNGLPWEYIDVDMGQIAALFSVEADQSKLADEGNECKRSEIECMTLKERKAYLYRIFRKLTAGECDDLKGFLQNLLEANIEKRREMALCDDDYGIISELSLYMLPPVVVSVYAAVRHNEFWEAWDSLEVKGYDDTFLENDPKEQEERDIKRIPFYRVIQRDSEDEFLEFWDGENLVFSKSLLERLEDWKERYEKIEIPLDMQVENYLAEIIEDLKEDWNCRFVDKKVVIEFLEHKDSEPYRRALVLFREMMDEDLFFFPELTRRQAIDWVIKTNRNSFDFIAMGDYQSLLGNHRQRMELLGF